MLQAHSTDMSDLHLLLDLHCRYPARGGIRILELQYTDGSRSPLDRFVAEEMIIDLLVAFDAHRSAL